MASYITKQSGRRLPLAGKAVPASTKATDDQTLRALRAQNQALLDAMNLERQIAQDRKAVLAEIKAKRERARQAKAAQERARLNASIIAREKADDLRHGGYRGVVCGTKNPVIVTMPRGR
jgi:hypothetical protein